MCHNWWSDLRGKNILLTDEKCDTAIVTISNVLQSNGVIHVFDTVFLPGYTGKNLPQRHKDAEKIRESF